VIVRQAQQPVGNLAVLGVVLGKAKVPAAEIA